MASVDFDDRLNELRVKWNKSRLYRPGVVPIPPIESNLRRYPAGDIVIGLERREFNEKLVLEHWARVGKPDGARDPEDDSGLSVHIFGPDGFEYLRFDALPTQPHYHYMVPGMDGIAVVLIDELAQGPMLPWLRTVLYDRLGLMLEAAGAFALSQSLDQAAVSAALDRMWSEVDGAEAYAS